MKTKTSLLICIFLSAFSLFAEELLRDVNFEQGFRLTALASTDNPVEIGKVFPREGVERPVWRLAQWGSKFNLIDAPLVENGAQRGYKNDGKEVYLKKEGETNVLVFALNTHNEYGKTPRASGEAWPHLLIEQEVESLPKISKLKSLKVSFSVKIDEVKKMRGVSYDDSLHAAQFVMFLTVQDRNKESKGYGDYLWFGIPIYDSRHKFPKEHRARDGGKSDGTGKYIYSIGGKELWGKAVEIGKWAKLEGELLKHVLDAFKDAQKKGYLENSKFEDMAISSLNSGWEVPGTFNVRSEFKNLNLNVEYK